MMCQVKEEEGREEGELRSALLGQETSRLESAGGRTGSWLQKVSYIPLAGLLLPSQNQSVCMGC